MGIERTVSFLPKGTQLLYFVNPSGDYDKNLLFEIGRNIDENKSKGNGIPILLEEEQEISFSISKNNNIQKKLKSCKCSSSAIPGKTLKSINDACQSISTVFEQKRASKGGKVYDFVYFQDDKDKKWKLLEILRKKIYSEHKAEFERHLISEGFGVGSYLQLHPDSIQHFMKLLGDTDNLIHDLKIQQSELKEKINYYNNLFQNLKISVYQQKIDDFSKRIDEDHYETKGDQSWQNWIYSNRWLFGTQYGKIIQKEKVGFDNIPDFILLTADGFLDLLEIKKPSSPVLVDDS